MKTRELLILNYGSFDQAVGRLFKEFDASEAFRMLFVEDPMRVIGATFFPDMPALPDCEIDYGNRLLYALLSNAKFAKWAKDFERSLYDQIKDADASGDPEKLKLALLRLDRRVLYADIAKGMHQFGDISIFASLLSRPKPVAFTSFESGVDIKLPDDVAVEIEILIYAIAVAAVFIIPVDFFFAPPTSGVSRDDLHRISNIMSTNLKKKALDTRSPAP